MGQLVPLRFGTLTTTHETALAAAAKNDGDGRRKEDKFENLRHLPWMNNKLNSIQEFQAAVAHELKLKQSVRHRAANEHSQAEDMLARAVSQLDGRRLEWKAGFDSTWAGSTFHLRYFALVKHTQLMTAM
jgi:hypothetical protein